VDKFLEGYDCIFLAYGQTGSGKTHTMFGTKDSLLGKDEGGLGLMPRAIIDALQKME